MTQCGKEHVRSAAQAVVDAWNSGMRTATMYDAIDALETALADPPKPDAMSRMPSQIAWDVVWRIADHPHVLGIYAAPEWEELGDDGKQWVRAIVEVSLDLARIKNA